MNVTCLDNGMPSGSKGLLNMTDITDMTEAELEKEFREEEEEEVEAAGERGQGRASTTPSTDRPSSSDSFKTTSANSSDLVSTFRVHVLPFGRRPCWYSWSGVYVQYAAIWH